VKSEDNSRNVYALFPGIDTTPFGKTPEAGDEGWSALPEPSIATESARKPSNGGSDLLETGLAQPRRSRISRVAALASLAAAIVAGAGFAAAQGLLSHPARKLAPLSASRGHHPSTRHAPTTHLRSAHSVRPRSPRHRHRRHSVKKATRASHSRTSATVVSTPPPTSPPATPVVASSGTSASGTSGTASPSYSHVTNSASTSSSRHAHHAGPSGRVALIGAGTTPSG
jgi:hypothetical protein